MSKINIAIVFSSLILNGYALDVSNLICGKEIYGPVEGTTPSSTEEDDYDDNNSKKGQRQWTPKPKEEEGDNPSLLKPKSSKEVFGPEE